jgi:hypothetical protein
MIREAVDFFFARRVSRVVIYGDGKCCVIEGPTLHQLAQRRLARKAAKRRAAERLKTA